MQFFTLSGPWSDLSQFFVELLLEGILCVCGPAKKVGKLIVFSTVLRDDEKPAWLQRGLFYLFQILNQYQYPFHSKWFRAELGLPQISCMLQNIPRKPQIL